MALASFSYDTGSSGSILDVSGGPQNSRLLGKIPSLGSVSNVNGTGDISIRKNSEGSFTVYVLATNNGLSALNVVLTAINKPTIPIIVSSTPLDRSIRLVWQACSDSTVDHYRIYVDTIPAPQVIWDSTSGGRFDTIRTIINLQNGFRYYIRITAVDYRGIESDFSNEISAVPQPPSNTVNVTFQFNTSTVLDTITSQSLIQIRGDQSPLTWDNSSVRMTCTGGDYWLATVRFPKGITIQYKYYVSQPGWENNSNRILVVGQNDTLLPLHYYNSQVPFVGTD
jgi:hypothetical protein